MTNKEEMVKKIMDMEENFHKVQVYYHILLSTLNKISYFNTIKIYNEYAVPNKIGALSLNTKEDDYSHNEHVDNILKILPNNMQKDFLYNIINSKNFNDMYNLSKSLNNSVNIVESKLTLLDKIKNINIQENSNKVCCRLVTSLLNDIGSDEFVDLYNDYAEKNEKFIIYKNVFANDENREMNLSIEISNVFSNQKNIEEHFILHVVNNSNDNNMINLLNNTITNYEQKINPNKINKKEPSLSLKRNKI